MDRQFKWVGFDVRMVRLQPWKLWLLAGVGGAMALALSVAVAGLFLILVPMFLVGGLVVRLLLRGGQTPATRSPSGGPEIIDGQYEILEPPRDRGRR